MNMFSRFRAEKLSSTHVWMCLLVILSTVFLRAWGISGRGVFDYDEAWYLLEAKSLHDTVDYALGALTDDPSVESQSLKTYLHERGTVPITSLKPGHNLLMLLSFLFLGVSDTTGLLVSVLFGTLTVGVVYRIAQHLFGDRTALFSSAILAASGFHIYYSRSAMAQADSTFFVALGLLVWVRSSKHDKPLQMRFITGLSLGLAVTCHYSAIIAPVLFIGLEGLRSLKVGTIKMAAKHMTVVGLGVLAPILSFELCGQLIKVAAGSPDGLYTYFEQFLVRDTDVMANAIAFFPSGAAIVFRKFLFTEGPLALLAMAAGIIVLLTSRAGQDEVLALLATAVGPILFWSLFSVDSNVRFRVMPIAFPSLAVVGGFALSRVLDLRGHPTQRTTQAAMAAIVLILLLTGVARSHALLGASSGYAEATKRLVALIEQQDGTIGFRPSSTWPIWNFHLSTQYDGSSIEIRKRIRPYLQQDDFVLKGDYDPLDFRRYFRAIYTKDEILLGYLKTRANASSPIITVDNSFTRLDPRYFGTIGSEVSRSLDRIRSDYPEAYQIRIFDIRSERPQIAEASR